MGRIPRYLRFKKSTSSAENAMKYPGSYRAIPVSHLKEFCRKYPEVLNLKTWQVAENYIKKLTGCSSGTVAKRYTELPNIPSAKVDIFVSHCWGGGFGTLVSAVVDFCDDDWNVWIDIFAVMQHSKDSNGDGDDDLKADNDVIDNSDLRFDLVIQDAKAVLLVCDVDEKVGNLSSYEVSSKKELSLLKDLPVMRIWCCYEILSAVQNKKPMFIQAGSTSKDSGSTNGTPKAFDLTTREAVLNLLQLVDVGKAEAKFQEDHDRILKEMENEGLAKCNSIVKGAITNAMAVIMAEDGDFRPVAKAALTENEKYIKDANYSQTQKDFAFTISAAGGLEFSMHVLYNLGADPNARFGWNDADATVHWAAQACQLDALTLLKNKYKVDLEVQNDLGWNAVVWASTNSDGMKPTVNKLKELGMDVCTTTTLKEEKLNLPPNKRLTHMSPVMWLIPARNKDGIESLVNDHNVDINAVNARGISAVMFAVAAGDGELLNVLKDLGADLNMIMKIDGLQLTAAHWAARNGHTSIVKTLVDLGANDMIEDYEGITVKELTKKDTMIDLFKNDAGAVDLASFRPKEGSLEGESRSDVRLATKMWELEGVILDGMTRQSKHVNFWAQSAEEEGQSFFSSPLSSVFQLFCCCKI